MKNNNKETVVMLIKEVNRIERSEDNKLTDLDMGEIQRCFDKPLIHNNDVDDYEGFLLEGMNW